MKALYRELQVVAGSGIVRIQGAAQLRGDTEDREIIRCDSLEAETQGLRTTGEVHVRSVAGNRYGLEYPGTLEVSPLRDGDAGILRICAGEIVLDLNQLTRDWIRQRVQQRGVDHTIDGGGGSDAQRHCGDRNKRESRIKENPGDLKSMRTAYRRSCHKVSRIGRFSSVW